MIDRFEKFSVVIQDISKYWHRLAAEEMDQYGLKGTHSVYLLVLARHPEGLTAAQLSELCSRDKADVSRMTAIMEQRGLTQRTGSQYRALYSLTKLGREAAERVSQRAGRAVELAGRDLSETKRAEFYAALDSISANLREMAENGIPE